MPMTHLAARTAIACLLDGDALGPRALAVAACVALREADAPSELIDLAEQQTAQHAPDHAVASSHPANQEPIPATPAQWLARAAELISEHPQMLGENLALAVALSRLWASATPAERPVLRNRFLAGLHARNAAPGSSATREHLRDWTRSMGTSHGTEPIDPTTMALMFQEDEARNAHIHVADQLMASESLCIPAHILATLAAQQAGTSSSTRSDMAIDATVAAMLLSAQCAHLVPEIGSVLVSQNAHQLWWALHGAQGQIFAATDDFAEALRSDPGGARRCARRAAGDGTLWPHIWPALHDLIRAGHRLWVMPALLAAEVRLRHASASHATHPDVAGAVAAVIARAHRLIITAS